MRLSQNLAKQRAKACTPVAKQFYGVLKSKLIELLTSQHIFGIVMNLILVPPVVKDASLVNLKKHTESGTK